MKVRIGDDAAGADDLMGAVSGGRGGRWRDAGWILALALGAASALGEETVWLDGMDLSHMRQGWGKPQVNRSIREKPLSIGGKKFERGVGTHAESKLWAVLPGSAGRFLASVGVDDTAGQQGTVVFRISADGRKLFDSGVMRCGDSAKSVDVALAGVTNLFLLVSDAGDGRTCDHGDWAEARFIIAGGKPVTASGPLALKEEAVILTPKAGPAPRINGPSVHGCRPGNPFIYRVPTTGERPITFSAEGLPDGLVLDAAQGIVTGTIRDRGEYVVTLRAKNEKGAAERRLRILCGDKIALTPTMGWNHWYAHYNRITDKMMRDAADIMVSSGMADIGYQYVSIDDCWMNAPEHADPKRVGPLRDERGDILPNQHFPDMRGLTDYIHAKGLKAGIYTSPGPLTCAKFAGSYGHEEQDARKFAEWGFDLLKYDWCSYGKIAAGDKSLEMMQKPYRLMGGILKRVPRDIVFNLCQYGMGEVWKWGEEIGGHSWRTAGDLGFELDRVFEVALANAEHREWNRPGAWNDPDYIQIGWVGNARGMGEPKPFPITPSEQYSFMSLWCLMASPLFYSGDMTRLDEFTLNVLCNPEVIEVNQDPLGQCARVVMLGEELFAMVKDMADGSKAVGLFNQGQFPAEVCAKWSDLGLAGEWRARDLWRQKDMGVLPEQCATRLARRGCFMMRLWKDVGK
ncbi:MAG TPA: NPCBM/NEW2 domain-containing protein [Verrucomicrobiae bacterium]|nr:NPCBM/NEW2 domain-containing protein [Verrucomicrobiae bacterium]